MTRPRPLLTSPGLDADALALRRAADLGIPLVDFEDADGRLPHEAEEHMPKSKMTVCRVCGQPAPRLGRYAGRCSQHRDGDQPQPAPEAGPGPDDLVVLAQQVTDARRRLVAADADLRDRLEQLKRACEQVMA